MAANTRTTLQTMLKEQYPLGLEHATLSRDDYAFMAVLPKRTDFGGENFSLPIKYGHGSGGSTRFDDSDTNKKAALYENFKLTPVHEFSSGSITGQAIKSSRNSAQSFVQRFESATEAAWEPIAMAIESGLFRTGGGSLGQYATTAAGTTITLVEPGDIHNFEVGLVITVTNGSTETNALRAGSMTVTKVDGPNNNVTFNALVGGITANDHLIRDGDDYATASAYQKFRGLLSWVGTSAPSATAFFGVDRTVHHRLGGLRTDQSGIPTVVEALINAGSIAAEFNARPTFGVLHHRKFRNLLIDLQDNVEYDKLAAQGSKGEIAEISFKTVKLICDGGPVDFMPNRFCKQDLSWMLDMKTWHLCSMGKLIDWVSEDGLTFRLEAPSTGEVPHYTCHAESYPQLGCQSPGKNIVVTLP